MARQQHHRPRPAVAAGLLAFALATSAATAQLTTAQCGDSFSWAKNSQGLSPCQLASSLIGPSYPTPPFTLPALGTGELYTGPNNTAPLWHAWNRALCSMEAYNAIAACEACQGVNWVSWATWTSKCGQNFTGDKRGAVYQFPGGLPKNLSAPVWLAYNSSATFNVNVMAALAASNGSSTVSQASPSATTGASAGAEDGGSNSVVVQGSMMSASPNYPGTGASAGSELGAIIGGVVAGLAIIGIVVACLVWMVRSARRRELGLAPPPQSKHRFNKPMEELFYGAPATAGAPAAAAHGQHSWGSKASGPAPLLQSPLTPGGPQRANTHSPASAHSVDGGGDPFFAAEQSALRRGDTMSSTHSAGGRSLYAPGGYVAGPASAQPQHPSQALPEVEELDREDSYLAYRR